MATKDITDYRVCLAYEEMNRKRDIGGGGIEFADKILMRVTGQPEKVCYRAMERAEDRGYIDCGVSLRSGWLTEEGKELLNGKPG